MKIYITSSLCLLLLAAGCSQSEKEILDNNGQKAVSFTANYASTRATETSFEQNDAISIFAFEGNDKFTSSSYYANNKKYVYNNGFKAANEPVFYSEENTPLLFYAIYPYNRETSAIFPFQIEINQNEKSNYTKSDLMTAETPLTTDIQPALAFSHRMSSALISINNQWEGFNISSVSINNLLTSATVNLITDNITVNEGNRNNINAYKEDGYKALFPPQEVAVLSDFVTINGSNASGNFTLVWKLNKKTNFKSGIRHEYKLSISKSGNVNLEGYNEYDFNAEIIPWGKPEGFVSTAYKIEAKTNGPNNSDRDWSDVVELTKDGIIKEFMFINSEIYCLSGYYILDRTHNIIWEAWNSNEWYGFDGHYNWWYSNTGEWQKEETDDYLLYDNYEEYAASLMNFLCSSNDESFTWQEFDNIQDGSSIWEVTLTRLKDFNAADYYKGKNLYQYYHEDDYGPYTGLPRLPRPSFTPPSLLPQTRSIEGSHHCEKAVKHLFQSRLH